MQITPQNIVPAKSTASTLLQNLFDDEKNTTQQKTMKNKRKNEMEIEEMIRQQGRDIARMPPPSAPKSQTLENNSSGWEDLDKKRKNQKGAGNSKARKLEKAYTFVPTGSRSLDDVDKIALNLIPKETEIREPAITPMKQNRKKKETLGNKMRRMIAEKDSSQASTMANTTPKRTRTKRTFLEGGIDGTPAKKPRAKSKAPANPMKKKVEKEGETEERGHTETKETSKAGKAPSTFVYGGIPKYCVCC